MSVQRVATRRSEITQATPVFGDLSGPAARIVLARLCAAGFVMGASTLTGIVVNLPAGRAV